MDLNGFVSGQNPRRRESSLSRSRDGFINGLNKVSRAVSRGYRTRRPGLGSARSDAHDTQEQTDPIHLAAPVAQPARWPSLSWRRNASVASDHAHDADDSFFLHGRDPSDNRPPNTLLPPARMKSPVLVELRPSADYAKMGSSISTEPDTSISAYLSRVQQFLKDVKDLPWSSSRPTFDYYPGQPNRRRDPDAEEDDEEWNALSWYALLHRQYIDLLSSEESGTRSLPPESSLAYQPNLAYDYETPNRGDPTYAFSQGHDNPTYPHGYEAQSSVEPQQNGHVPLNSWQIYGPAVPSHISGHQYPYPMSWPPPPPPLPHSR